MMGLKDIIDRMKEPLPSLDGEVRDIGDSLWQHLRSLRDEKDVRREEGYHPSGLYSFCPRREVLAHWFPKPEADFIPPETQMVFDWGTAWHWLVQNHYFGPMGILWGSWRCSRCSRTVKDSFMPEPCEECFGSRHRTMGARRGGYWTYIEPGVFNFEWNIPGHTDGILILSRKPEGKKSLLEIKTIDGELFKRLSRPDEKYTFQINVYLWLLGLDECWLTYWTKDAKQTKPKVFRIEFDPEIPKEVQRRIALHRRAWPEKRLCEGICRTEQDTSARRCPWIADCFRTDIELLVEKKRETSS